MMKLSKVCPAVIFSFAACFNAWAFSPISPATGDKKFIQVQQDEAMRFIAHKWRAYNQQPGGDRLAFTATFKPTGDYTLCIAPELYPNTCSGVNEYSYSIAPGVIMNGTLQISYRGIRAARCSQGVCVDAPVPGEFTGSLKILSAGEIMTDDGIKWTKMPEAF